MSRWSICWIVIAIAVTPVHAGKYFDPGAGLPSRRTQADCGRGRWPTNEQVPAWSRLHWSVAVGGIVTRGGTAVFAPELGFALWARDWQCASGTSLFTDELWQRWSLAVTADLTFRNRERGADLRPALRLARSHARRGLLSFGTAWVPSTELFVSLGPTFEPGLSGAAVGVGGRFSIIALELRVAVRTGDRDPEVMLLFGLTDVHGLWRLGPRRPFTPPPDR